MNAFYEHHQHSIAFHYRCFDRILLNAAIQPFQQPERVMGFFWAYRQLYPVSRQVLRDIATQYHNWVTYSSQKWGAPVLQAPEGRRDDFVAPYFRGAQPDQVVAILKAREPARILVSIAQQATEQGHLEYKTRWVDQYNFYLQDRDWGRVFVRVCPYFPFSARVYLNQHAWLANRLREQGIRFQAFANASLHCSDPQILRQLADSLQPHHLIACAQKWLARLTPFFTARERGQAGVQHRLFLAQIEYCDNLIFKRRAALDALSDRLLDANRQIGRPRTLSLIFGRRITRHHRGKLQTVIQDLDLGNPAIRSHYRNGFIKQYARDRRLWRTERATHPGPEAGPPPTTGSDAGAGSLLSLGRGWPLHHPRTPPRHGSSLGLFHRGVQAQFAPLRTLQAARQRAGGENPSLAPLPPAARRLSPLRRLLEAL